MVRWSSSARCGLVAAGLIVAACAGDGDASTTSVGTVEVANTELVEHRVCVAMPGAACSLAESFDPPVAPGTDLTGIDLRGANLGEDVDLSDVVLNGARLDGASLHGKMTGADLTSASLTDADLNDTDLTNATLTGATLTGADVNATLFDADDLPPVLRNVTVGVRSGETLSGVNLRGFDLTGAKFASLANGVAPMAGARFTGATLTGAAFDRIDLTGADFSDATFAVDGGPEPTFTDTTCPDFLPSNAALKGRAACRL